MPKRLSRARPGLPAAGALFASSSFRLLLLLLASVPGALGDGVYTPDDPLVVFSAETLQRSLFNSSSAWVVEFYVSWCGHCIDFAPTWKALANDIQDWGPAVTLGVLDCDAAINIETCSDFGITSYPTLKFFKAFSKKPEDGIELAHKGDDIRSLRECIITLTGSHRDPWPPACPALELISEAELNDFFHTNDVTYLALIFEKEDSFLASEVAWDMLQFENIAVRRVLNSSEELVWSFNVTTFPSAFLLANNGSNSSIPADVDSVPLYRYFLEKLPGVYRRDSFKPTLIPPTTYGPWKAIDSTAELQDFFLTNNVTHLALIFEKEDSFLGSEVTLDMLQFENIAVRRVLNSNEELVWRFSVTTFPSGVLLVNNDSCSSIPAVSARLPGTEIGASQWQGDLRQLYRDFLKNLPGVFRGDSIKPIVLPALIPPTTSLPWTVIDRRKLYMADVESAVLYTLRREATRKHFKEEQLSALKQYVAVLVKYFPGRLPIMNYLRNLDGWLQPKTCVSKSEWKEALRNKNELPNAWLPENPTWVWCQGSRRGYPCGLWTLFHLLTVQEALFSCEPHTPPEVLPAMRRYIRYFFGCRECAVKFEAKAAESMNKVRNKSESILWLWSRHNEVNTRLAGAVSEDPKFPKIQWPPQDLCLSCHITINGSLDFDESAILRFFKSHFSRGNIYLDFLKAENGLLVRQGRDVEERDYEADRKLEGGGGGGGQETGRGDEEEEKKRTERKKSGFERSGSLEAHKPSIVKMNTKTKELEENIVDLDTFSEQHFRSKALKMASSRHSHGRTQDQM